MNHKTRYSLNDQIAYVTDINCVKVYINDPNNMVIISYPEAALWNMIQQGYSSKAMVDMMAAILKKNKPETAVWMSKRIEGWIDSRLLSS